MTTSSRPSVNILILSSVYCATCFIVAVAAYAIALAVEPVDFTLSLRTWVASFLFVATATTIFCSGGLVGVWLLIASIQSPLLTHIKAVVLIASIGSGFFFAFTLGEDRILLGAIVVATASLAIALLARTYTSGSDTRPLENG